MRSFLLLWLCLLSLSSSGDIHWFTNVEIFLTSKNILAYCLSINQLVYLIPILHQHYIRGALFTSSTLPCNIYYLHAQVLSCVWLFCDPMDCGWPDSFVHGIFPGKNIGMGCHFLLQGTFLTQGSNVYLLHLLHWQADSLPAEPPGRPSISTD